MTGDLDTRRRRAHWRAGHRGTKEMDLLLGRYAEAHLSAFDENELTRFERLLELPDPDLQSAILAGRPMEDPEAMQLVQTIRAFHKLAPATT